MTRSEGRYKTPASARAAVTDKLRSQAKDSPWVLADLQRQYAYDQLVERLYRLDERWVVKGATALLARRVSVRHTIDIDLYRPGAIAEVERQVREAAVLDIGDWMGFEVGPAVHIRAAGAEAIRLKMTASIGAKIWTAFQVDVVADGVVMVGQPDLVRPLTSVEISHENRRPWRAYPLVDHVADKVCAIFERHEGRVSTRFKDLIDLVAISQRATVSADLQLLALTKEADRRALTLLRSFNVPDPEIWIRGYRAEAKRTVGLEAVELDDAVRVVRPFLDPLLSHSATGDWNPQTREWESSSPTEEGSMPTDGRPSSA
jgi:predicted nucleotidyltransferase component of viral defense system